MLISKGNTFVRRRSPWTVALLALSAVVLSIGAPSTARAQLVAGGDFDICDYCGDVVRNTLFLRGRSGFGTNVGTFVIINSASAEQDVDNDGFTPGVDFQNLHFQQITDFRNVIDPSVVVSSDQFLPADFLNPVLNGFARTVGVSINIPNGTPAGLYRGHIVISDSINRPGVNPNGELLRSDLLNIEIEVLPNRGFELFQGDTGALLDSLVLTGRPGQTVSGVVRIANAGNVGLAGARIEATDLVSTAGTGLRIRRERISFSPAQIPAVGLDDTARVVVSVAIPPGTLPGTYRGDLIVQAEDAAERRVPLIVHVVGVGGIVFENNPVIGRAGDNAVIIFNGDPGTAWELRIFDMMGITTFAASGTVFAGQAPPTGQIGGFQGDQAVRYTWPLLNGQGYPVAGGMYYVIVLSTQEGVSRQLRGKLMVIR